MNITRYKYESDDKYDSLMDYIHTSVRSNNDILAATKFSYESDDEKKPAKKSNKKDIKKCMWMENAKNKHWYGIKAHECKDKYKKTFLGISLNELHEKFIEETCNDVGKIVFRKRLESHGYPVEKDIKTKKYYIKL